MQISNYRSQFWQGVRDLMPLVSGVLPFGLIVGANGVALDMNPEQIMGMTVLFFAGSAQLAALQLMQENATFVVIVLTTIVINLRFAIYSATFAPLFYPLKKRYRLPIAYILSDQAYGLCIAPDQLQRSDAERISYYLGTAIALLVSWVLSVMMGIAVGASIPPEWMLGFTIPLAFLAMLIATITNRLLLIVAVVSGLVAIFLQGLPYNLGFILAVIAGVIAGLGTPRIVGRSFNSVMGRPHE